MLTLGTQFGAKVNGGTSDEQITVLEALGVNLVRPPAIILKTYNGVQKRLEDLFQAGKGCIQNICYDSSTDPLPFCTNLPEYRQLCRKVFTTHGGMIKIAVIENEPTTDEFYSGNITDYLKILPIAIDEAHKADVLITDGCTHVEFITTILTVPRKRWRQNVIDVYTMIQAYKTMRLDYVNLHTSGSGSSYPPNQIINAVNYIRNETGKKVMMNEFHTEGATQGLVEDMVGQIKEADIKFGLIYGGSSSTSADEINVGNELTEVGDWYAAAVQP